MKLFIHKNIIKKNKLIMENKTFMTILRIFSIIISWLGVLFASFILNIATNDISSDSLGFILNVLLLFPFVKGAFEITSTNILKLNNDN